MHGTMFRFDVRELSVVFVSGKFVIETTFFFVHEAEMHVHESGELDYI